MKKFEFYNPTRIVFGQDRLGQLDDLIAKDAKVLITYGGGSIKRFGTLDKIRTALGHRQVFEFPGIEPNPQYETVMKAVKVIKEKDIDFILAVGGGSVLDASKFMAAALYFEDQPFKILYGESNKITKAMDFGTVLTLPATGSEMNSGGVICHLDGKYGFGNPLLYPKFSFLDPTLTYTLPSKQVANGVVDSFVHVMEQYMVETKEARVQDRHSEGIMLTLKEIGLKTVNEPEDYDARANLMWCATNALNGWIGLGQTQDWMTHSIGHELTAEYNIDHAQTLAIVLPSLLRALRKDREAKLLQWSERVWNITQGSNEERVLEGIKSMEKFFESVGLKTRMSDLGYDESFVEIIAKRCEDHGLLKWFETKKITKEVLLSLLKASF